MKFLRQDHQIAHVNECFLVFILLRLSTLLRTTNPFTLFKKKTCLFLAILGLHCFLGVPLVVVSRGYSLGAVHWLLIAVASLVAEHVLQRVWASAVAAHRLSNCGSRALECRAQQLWGTGLVAQWHVESPWTRD